MKSPKIIPSSFRDPSGFLFYLDGSIFRQVNLSYKENYELLMKSGLYKSLIDENLLIPHQEVDIKSPHPTISYKVIKPEFIPFISYPYEWCFSQLKNAALTTLKIQKKALKYGMTLKDCSAYNIQFRRGKPLLIDSLSFERYQEGEPWVAYRQFCQHFLSALALMSLKNIRLNLFSRVYIDGFPLDLTSSMLPVKSFFKLPLLLHVHLHAKSQSYFSNKTLRSSGRKISRKSFLGLIDNLESAVKKLDLKKLNSEWSDYYNNVYLPESFTHKRSIVANFLEKINPKAVWDLGANVGVFSRIAANRGIYTISFDIDPVVVEINYLQCLRDNETNILPLVIDLTNPSPGIGWENQERLPLTERGPTDTVLALALIHHLAIRNNLPLNKIAHFLSKICTSLIIEYIPKNDEQVLRLLSSRKNIFPVYSKEIFEREFKNLFRILHSVRINNTERILYLMRKGAV